MAWARIDDKFLDNPKVRMAGKEATYLYISALVYASNQLTEGFISDEVLGLVAFKGFIKNELTHARTLVNCGLWDRLDNGYQIHDFLEYNPSRAEIEQARAKKQAAGSKGGQASAQARAQAFAQAFAQPSAQAESNDTPSINPSPTHTTKDKPVVVGSARGEVFKVYENEIGPLTPFISDNIKEAERDYPEGWVIEAIHEAAINNGKSWKYVSAILQNWQQHGFKAPRPKQSNGKRLAPVNQGLEAVKAMAAEEGVTLNGIFTEGFTKGGVFDGFTLDGTFAEEKNND